MLEDAGTRAGRLQPCGAIMNARCLRFVETHGDRGARREDPRRAPGLPAQGPHREKIQAQVRTGLPYSALEAVASGFAIDLGDLVTVLHVPARTLARRKRQKRFRADESDRLFRLGRIATLAEEVLGSRAKAIRWLHQPNRALGNAAPLRKRHRPRRPRGRGPPPPNRPRGLQLTRVWRICRQPYVAFDGDGARQAGGRSITAASRSSTRPPHCRWPRSYTSCISTLRTSPAIWWRSRPRFRTRWPAARSRPGPCRELAGLSGAGPAGHPGYSLGSRPDDGGPDRALRHRARRAERAPQPRASRLPSDSAGHFPRRSVSILVCGDAETTGDQRGPGTCASASA